MPLLCWIPVDPGCFLGAGIVIPAHFGVWDNDPGWVPGQRHLWPEMRRNAEISIAAESSHPCGANWHNKKWEQGILAGLLYNAKEQAATTA